MRIHKEKDAFLTELHKRMDFLNDLIVRRSRAVQSAPEGKLNLSGSGGSRCYYRKDPAGPRIYLGKDKISLARRLAQKEYDEKVIMSAKRELSLEEKLVHLLETDAPEDVFDRLPEGRKKLVDPAIPDLEDFIREWCAVSYANSVYEGDIGHYTENGERVRSKSEVLIANTLHAAKVPYRYEYPVYLEGYGTVYPDFRVLNIRTGEEYIWEHFGMMDDPDYADSAVRKMLTYEMNGFFQGKNLITTMETRMVPLNIKTIARVIELYLK